MESNLAQFIGSHSQQILDEWEAFARTLLPAAAHLTPAALRDHGEQLLAAIQKDLQTPQSAQEQLDKSHGLASRVPGSAQPASEVHALLRATDGFSLQQLVGEYRALRASVLRLWKQTNPQGDTVIDEIGRFNEAIDQAVAESVAAFQHEVERWRSVFLGVLGHELRGPLNAILLSSQAIRTLAADSPLSESNERLMRGGKRMAALLDDLLEYNRTALGLGISVKLAECDLVQVLQEEIDLRRAGAGDARIDFVAPPPCHGLWDASRLRQVVGNLVSNALHHGDPGKPITVRLEPGEQNVKVSVENSGPDISEDMKDLIFEPLRRAAGEGEGVRTNMGLGLFIAREIVRSHRGAISVASEGGRTAFTVELPGRTTLG